MLFKDHTYSVLIVSGSEKFACSTRSLLPQSDFWPIDTVKNAGEARRSALEVSYDIILINTPLNDEFGSAFAMDICRNTVSSVLLFVKSDMYDEIYSAVMEAGVMVISKPTSTQTVIQSLRMLCAARERLRAIEAKQATVEEKIKEIRIVNKAKWLLIECLNMTEDEAHKYIEKQAMNMRIPIATAARNIIKTYS